MNVTTKVLPTITATVIKPAVAQEPVRVLLDETCFLQTFKLMANAAGRDGFVVNGQDYLFEQDSQLASEMPEAFVWSMVEDDLGEAQIISGLRLGAIGVLVASVPRPCPAEYQVDLEGF